MSVNMFEDKKGTAPDPSQAGDAQPQQEQTNHEGDFRNVETSVNSKKYFDDDFESQQEDQMSTEEADTEKEGRTGKS
jgi:hypothetical protein